MGNDLDRLQRLTAVERFDVDQDDVPRLHRLQLQSSRGNDFRGAQVHRSADGLHAQFAGDRTRQPDTDILIQHQDAFLANRERDGQRQAVPVFDIDGACG
ncbi:hypothetical protein D3C86_1859010 [compost metagenome]